MVEFVKLLILWAEMMGGCLDGAAPEVALNMSASEPVLGVPRHVVMSATVTLDTADETVDCLSAGVAELGW